MMDLKLIARRDFLRHLSVGAVSLSGIFLVSRFLTPIHVFNISRRIKIGKMSDFPLGTSLHFPSENIFLFHTPDGLYAVSGRCTHLGCSITMDADGFSCPCHGAKFSNLGEVKEGPALRPLEWIRLEKDSSRQLWMYPDLVVAPHTWITA